MERSKILKTILWNFLSLLLFSGLAFANTVSVSIPDTTGAPGDVIKVPILVKDILPSDTVWSADIIISYDPAIAQVETVIFSGTLVSGWFYEFKIFNDSIIIALAGADSISGSGTLAYLKLKVPSSALPGDTSILHFRKMVFNDGAPPVSFKDGVLRITPTSVSENENLNLPQNFNLGQNFPNPFNPTTTIPFKVKSLEFGVGRPTHTTLIVYNILGQRIRSLVDENLNSGTYQLIWDAKNDKGEKVPSGVYFYRLTSGDISEVRKMVLLR
ncbi:MAG: cohesin domain-containing protein [Candidatus Zixiibacteriota bacterium]